MPERTAERGVVLASAFPGLGPEQQGPADADAGRRGQPAPPEEEIGRRQALIQEEVL